MATLPHTRIQSLQQKSTKIHFSRFELYFSKLWKYVSFPLFPSFCPALSLPPPPSLTPFLDFSPSISLLPFLPFPPTLSLPLILPLFVGTDQMLHFLLRRFSSPLLQLEHRSFVGKSHFALSINLKARERCLL